MAGFVQGVAGDILRAIAIEVRQGNLVVVQRLVRVYLDGWIIADTTQLRILCPKSVSISSAAARKRRIAMSPWVRLPPVLVFLSKGSEAVAQQPGAHGCSSRRNGSVFYE